MSKRDAAPSAMIEIRNVDRFFPDLLEAWQSRELAWVFARRNIKVRFQQTILGRFWLILQPLPLTAVLTVFLGNLLAVPSDGMPYALFAFAGTALWNAFQRTLTEASMSLVASGALLSKVYFPRLLVPVSAFLTSAIDTIPLYLVLIIAGPVFHLFPGWPILLSPLFLLLALLIALGIGLWVTVIDALYRDVRVVVPMALQLGFYLSPIVYAASVVPERWRVLYQLNPLVGILQGFRWSVAAGVTAPSLVEIAFSVGVTAIILLSGLVIFARLERAVVDHI